MLIAPDRIEEAAKELYLRALRDLPPDIKRGFAALAARETGATAKAVLGTMIENIAVAERTNNLLCQDTGIPIYNVTIGRECYGRRRCADGGDSPRLRARDPRSPAALVDRASAHAEERAHVVRHRGAGDPNRILRCFRRAPDRDDSQGQRLREQLVAQDGDPGRGRRCDHARSSSIACSAPAGRRARRRSSVSASAAPPTSACTLRKSPRPGPSASHCADPDGATLETQLSDAVNLLGVGPQGLGGDATAFAVHVEIAATHITMNPVAVNMQCHSARRASARAQRRGRRVRLLMTSATAMAHHDFAMPVTEAQVRALAVDDTVTLNGTLFGIRDATQIALFDHGRTTRFDLAGHAVIHTAPNVKQVDAVARESRGLRADLRRHHDQREDGALHAAADGEPRRAHRHRQGWPRAPTRRRRFGDLGGVYLAIIGGAAALETTWVEAIDDVDLDDLNPESLWKFRVRGFGPLRVADGQPRRQVSMPPSTPRPARSGRRRSPHSASVRAGDGRRAHAASGSCAPMS